ncbi:M1 family metallopeptidase [Streptomyces qinzhouensis]|uniref:M1 family metallopeptidase n=1 Tax=Streptomyces qinzhouensis TaxID=2599401 RepID=A0A5B8J753_9ACTN|nr:M1 family metallopeptidase [Streptomyces qinzhouensis]QDY75751.1 M1 family metallopeptidase [Streptomyces qinzhouensis]
MSRSARLLTVVLGCFALLASLPGGTPPGNERHPGSSRTPASAAYTVELAGDSSGGQWSGHQRVTFTQVSVDPLREVFLRLWGNAPGGCSAPAVTVTDLVGGTADGLRVGCTALRIALPEPLGPGERHTIGFDFTVRAPELADSAGRFGRHGAYSHFGNALPVLAVRDGAGWHLDPFTGTGESFYTLAADFTVVLDHPSALQVPATGSATDTPGTAGRTVTTVTAREVRDFAWSAGPFDTVSDVSAGGVTIKVHSGAGIAAADARAMLAAAGSGLDTHARAFGAYPYTELDVVVDNDLWFSGMEYPGFVLNRVKTSALIHEIAHQWWYGVVGDDQYRRPWLDESFAEYATELALGRDGSGCWRAVEWSTPRERITNGMAYWDEHPDRYEDVVYGYGACALHDLRRRIGADAMTRLLRGYVRTHRYGVSTTSAFKAAARAATAEDLTRFWADHRIDG